MMNEEVQYVKPTKWHRAAQVARGVLSFRFFQQTVLLFAYYIINYVNGYRLCQKGKGVNVHPTVILRHPENITIGSGAFLNHNNVLQAGKKSAKIDIGRNVMTGPGVMMFAYNHGMKKSGIPMIEQAYTEADITIGDDVWIGAGVIILAGVCIGKGAVIAAGAIVTRDIPSDSIAGGNPAKVLKMREA